MPFMCLCFVSIYVGNTSTCYFRLSLSFNFHVLGIYLIKWAIAVLPLTLPSGNMGKQVSGPAKKWTNHRPHSSAYSATRQTLCSLCSAAVLFLPQNTLYKISGELTPAAWPSNSLPGNEFKLLEKKLPLLSFHWLTSNYKVLRRDSKLQAALHHCSRSPTGGFSQRAACQRYCIACKHSSESAHFPPH